MARTNSSLLAGLNEALLESQSDPQTSTPIFIHFNNRIYDVEINIEDLTAGEVISQGIKKFNLIFNLGLREDPTMYQLYGAKKNGHKKSDLPGIQHEQLAAKTKLKRFNIELISEDSSTQNKKSECLSIKSQKLAEEKRVETNVSVEVQKGFWASFCLKFSWKRS